MININIIQKLKNFIEIVVASYWGGIFCIVFGCFLIYISYKDRKKSDDFYFRGWFAGLAGVLSGILILIMKILGKW